jgi:Skp family chaperone for outer membrane proteins
MMKKLVVLVVATVAFLTTGLSQSNFAHVNTQRVLDTMPSRKAAILEIEKFEERAMNELQETQTKLQADYQKLQTEKGTMSPTAYKFEENRLMKKSQEFQQRQQELDQQIQYLSQELNEPILETVQKAIEKVSQLEKVDYVLDESGLLYAKGKDLTNKVIAEVMKMENEKTTSENNAQD